MEFIIVLYWLLSLAAAATTMPFQSEYSLCIDSVPCRCSRDVQNRLFVDCSKLNLTEIPRIRNDAVSLSLNENEITVVENRTFSNLPQLLSLDLSRNYIRKIERDGFIGLDNLQSLDLSHNTVPLTAHGFQAGVFRPLKNLCYLNTQNLQATRENSSYPDEAFADLISLVTLKIDGKPNAIFGPGFRKLPSLRILKLASKKCVMESVSNNTFVNIFFLTVLDISNCFIRRIEPGAFIPLTDLRYLDISNNVALGLDGLRNASFGLINGSITVLMANKLYPTVHLSVQLNINHIEFLYQTNIKEVHLNENQIELIESGWGDVCPKSLETVFVLRNKFSFGYYIFETYKCNNIKFYHGGYQHESHTPFTFASEIQYAGTTLGDKILENDFETCKHITNKTTCIKKIEENIQDFMSYCDISRDSRYVTGLKSYASGTQSTHLRTLNGKHENINNINVSIKNTSFSVMGFPVTVPPNLKEIHIQFADLRYELPELIFPNNSVTFITVSGNSFYNLTGPLVGLDKLKILYASNNLCSYVSERFFEKLNNLEYLHLGDNALGLVFQKDSEGRILGKLNILRKLILSNNQIPSLPFHVFSGLHSLEWLDISRNYLRTFDIQMDHMKVTHLDISRNLLSSLPASVRQQLTDQAKLRNVSIDLTNNPFQCDCNTLDFMKWAYDQRSRITFIGFDNYTCNVNDNEQSFMNIGNLILVLEKKCANYAVAIWISSIIMILFVVLVTAGIIYRYRWKLRYIYYMTKGRYRGYTGLYKNENYQFDAFLSYADNNLRFVRFTLLPKVETEGLHLCIHHRDFLAGEEIAANIANAIHRSRKTVVLLDDDFLSSYWCMYELNMARMESVYSRRGDNILVLLFKEGIDRTKLPLEFMDLIHQRTYIELPEDLVTVDLSHICSRLREAILQ